MKLVDFLKITDKAFRSSLGNAMTKTINIV